MIKTIFKLIVTSFLNQSSKGIYGVLLLLPLTLFAVSPNYYADIVKTKNLHNSKIWKSLIHSTHGSPSIYDPSFLLSYEDFSPLNELNATLQGLFDPTSSEGHIMCRFPARAHFLIQALDIRDDALPKIKCEGLDEYLQKTNADAIALVFSSENVTNPSSMMGHTFIKISGMDEHKQKTEHAVSFYTIIDTVNIPWLIVESTMIGMPGFFSLTHYSDQLFKNLVVEERNIWEYTLDLTPDERRLFYLHFWELKDINLSYLFTGFNCATIIYDMLAISHKKETHTPRLWITPKDLVKEVNRQQMVRQTRMIPSERWYIKALGEEVAYEKKSQIKTIFDHQLYGALERFDYSEDVEKAALEKELIKHYANYLHDAGDISTDHRAWVYQAIQSESQTFMVNLNDYKSPLYTFDDTKVAIGFQREEARHFAHLTVVPTSHNLYDDNRQYFSETSLEIGAFNLIFNEETAILDYLHLYKIQSLIPRDPLTGGVSMAFKLNYEKHHDERLKAYRAYNVSGGAGLTYQFMNDIFVYGLAQGGVAYGNDHLYLYGYPEMGVLVYELLNMKTTASYRYIYNQDDTQTGYSQIDATQVLFIEDQATFNVGYQKSWNERYSNESLQISFHYFF